MAFRRIVVTFKDVVVTKHVLRTYGVPTDCCDFIEKVVIPDAAGGVAGKVAVHPNRPLAMFGAD